MEVQDKGKDSYGNVKYQYSVVVEVQYTFYAEDGTSVNAIGVGHALDTSDKGTNKAQSSAFKYCLMQALLIPTADDKDVENNNNTVAVKLPKNLQKTVKQIELPNKIDAEYVDRMITSIVAGNVNKVYPYFKAIQSEKKEITADDYSRLENAISEAYKTKLNNK